MPLRSDFKISAVTPEAPTLEPKRTVNDLDLHDLEAEIKEFGLTQRHLGIIRERTQPPTRAAAPAAESGPQPHRVAILVTHGMGQQVPFETLSMIGQALVTEHSKRHSADKQDDFKVDVRRVRLTSAPDAPELSRAEVTLPPQKGTAVEAHIYESYWAPLTEGQISFLQTVAFLYSAAWNGIYTYIKARWPNELFEGKKTAPPEPQPSQLDDGFWHFDRWIFGQFYDMPIKAHTLSALIAALVSVTVLLAPAILLFTSSGLTFSKKIYSLYKDSFFHWPLAVQILIFLVVIGLVVLALLVRYFVVEYVGDVAIYVSSYKVSRFDAIRNAILEQACTVARQIYSAGISDNSQLRYDTVVIVGHSLGSVISYDMLNAAINWDQVECNFERQVVPRTTRLITFGSPLDKTAFLFRTQVSSARNLREALAARMQPLILDYQKFRPLDTFRWINIHAPADIISGHLDYYDVPETDKDDVKGFNPVFNKIDPEATTPLLAHVQYWENEMLHEELYDAAWAAVPVAET